jgi:pyruvate formate lyase activating enzyme
MERRDFIKVPFCLAAGMALGKLHPGGEARAAETSDPRFSREAMYYKKRDGGQVECQLCPRRCVVSDQENGWCGVRFNNQGTYQTQVFGRVVTLAIDPIEKKPLFHFHPGSNAFSLATAGCNFECLFCQNWEISQFRPEQVPARFGYVSPEELVANARRKEAKSIAFTYSEPTIFYEYMLAIAKAAKAVSIPSVMISNGYIEAEPMNELLPVLGAVKIDFKAFSEDFYQKVCRGTLAPVLETMKRIKKAGVWLEMVHLTIPTLNDDPEQHKKLCDWILTNLGPDVPLHFTRFHPIYKMKNLPPTPPSTLEKAYELARKAGLHYVYVGNLPGHQGENTYCHACGELALRRVGFTVVDNKLNQGRCGRCGQRLPGVWD